MLLLTLIMITHNHKKLKINKASFLKFQKSKIQCIKNATKDYIQYIHYLCNLDYLCHMSLYSFVLM